MLGLFGWVAAVHIRTAVAAAGPVEERGVEFVGLRLVFQRHDRRCDGSRRDRRGSAARAADTNEKKKPRIFVSLELSSS